jgi:hypothetical protein
MDFLWAYLVGVGTVNEVIRKSPSSETRGNSADDAGLDVKRSSQQCSRQPSPSFQSLTDPSLEGPTVVKRRAAGGVAMSLDDGCGVHDR